MGKNIKNVIKKFIPWMDRDKKIYRLYKKSNKLMKNGHRVLADYYSNKIYRKYGCLISPKAQIGKNLTLYHPIGIVIGEGVKIGENVTIYQNVTLGRRKQEIEEYPKIGNNVTIYANSVIIGNITIGNGAIIGCGAIVLKDVKENSVCTGVWK